MDIEFLVDWLGNEIRVGDRVVYSSSCQRTGMNLGVVERIDSIERKVYGLFQAERRVKVRIEKSSDKSASDRAVVLLERDGAFRSITKWLTA